MNAVTAPKTTQLPAHLASFGGLLALSDNVTSGISSGLSHHRISIKGNRWRLNSPDGEETVAPTLYLDVIVLDANPSVSKIYYANTYNPADTEAAAPDCWSDNGLAPSINASKPQCLTCGACPHNAWGSKITPSGGKTKACGDSKKVAVVRADNPTGPVYELRVPAASLQNLVAAFNQLKPRGIPVQSVITRLEFDEKADYPKVLFKMIGFITPEQADAIRDRLNTDEVERVVNKSDQPIKELNGSAAQPVAAAPAQPVAPTPTPAAADPLFVEAAAPKPAARTRGAKKAAPAPTPEDAAFDAAFGFNNQGVPVGKDTLEEDAAFLNPSVGAKQSAQNIPGSTAVAASNDLDALLDGIM
jgi:hypothetical protein